MCACVFIHVCVCAVILHGWVVTFAWPRTCCVVVCQAWIIWFDPHYNSVNVMNSTQRWKTGTCPRFPEPWCVPGADCCTGCLSPKPWLSVRTSECRSLPLQWLWLCPWDSCIIIFLTKKKKKIKCNLTPHSAILGSWVQCTCVCYFSNKFWGIAAFKPQCKATLW